MAISQAARWCTDDFEPLQVYANPSVETSLHPPVSTYAGGRYHDARTVKPVIVVRCRLIWDAQGRSDAVIWARSVLLHVSPLIFHYAYRESYKKALMDTYQVRVLLCLHERYLGSDDIVLWGAVFQKAKAMLAEMLE